MSLENTAARAGVPGRTRGRRRPASARPGPARASAPWRSWSASRSARAPGGSPRGRGRPRAAPTLRRRSGAPGGRSDRVVRGGRDIRARAGFGPGRLVPGPLAQVTDALAAGDLIAQDAAISSLDVLSDRAGPAALVGARFTGAERAEAEGLLAAEPGTRFNLSPAEIGAFRRLRAPPPAAARLAQAWDEYGRLLGERWEAYRQGGISAVAPYARPGAPSRSGRPVPAGRRGRRSPARRRGGPSRHAPPVSGRRHGLFRRPFLPGQTAAPGAAGPEPASPDRPDAQRRGRPRRALLLCRPLVQRRSDRRRRRGPRRRHCTLLHEPYFHRRSAGPRPPAQAGGRPPPAPGQHAPPSRPLTGCGRARGAGPLDPDAVTGTIPGRSGPRWDRAAHHSGRQPARRWPSPPIGSPPRSWPPATRSSRICHWPETRPPTLGPGNQEPPGPLPVVEDGASGTPRPAGAGWRAAARPDGGPAG